ncbi:MAG: nitroreductase family protein [Armatimonadota bacterium]
MDLMQAITTRRSVRKYLPEPVGRETLEELITAATQAPSAMNSQPWAFGVIEGAETLRAYSDRTKTRLLSMAGQMPWIEHYRGMFEDPAFNIFYGAPALVLICAKPGGVHGEGDCAMAAQTLMLAARDKGLGTCWIGFFSFLLNQPEEKAALGIPAEYQPVAPIIVGRPDGDMPPPEKNAPEMLFWK